MELESMAMPEQIVPAAVVAATPQPNNNNSYRDCNSNKCWARDAREVELEVRANYLRGILCSVIIELAAANELNIKSQLHYI